MKWIKLDLRFSAFLEPIQKDISTKILRKNNFLHMMVHEAPLNEKTER